MRPPEEEHLSLVRRQPFKLRCVYQRRQDQCDITNSAENTP